MKTLDQIGLDPRERLALEEVSETLRARFPVDEVVLFGSTARGTADAESDVDLLILTRARLGDQQRSELMQALVDLQLELDLVIGPLVVPVDDWYRGIYQALPLHREVERDGVRL